ncbi:MAG TPA: adenylate/guanylate cyclase domain-containing protein, partial [Dongiaceae bacterium]|nr:adenylate/guanylate cyclase domain-containing protein [Dongiaceae bacterium]
MAEGRVRRHLAAILAADVVGYSALMEKDETGTFDRLRAHRKELFEPQIKACNGRIFKLLGDGLLAEFASVVDAVQCAITLQREMARRNSEGKDGERIDVRISVNLGDVIIEGKDRYGDGINIAARLQELAEPGGIAVSGWAYDHLTGKLDLPIEFVGQLQVKNIERPVRVYR